ncbi:helix-turn-helix domain-containing protein, partial [Nocardioides sp. AX2bis]|uniref:helix-turn-helix domain-containing protein n=1 Tax=Nocardioides sp. AX2bis TaxID=2653157 RepID=UPI00135942C1
MPPTRRRRPGPPPTTFEPPYDDNHASYGTDPTDDLERQPRWSTGDVARYYRLSPATVRQWVRRGHLRPAGKVGGSHVFDRDEIFV